MKANQIETGKTHLAKVSGRLVPVKVLGVVWRPHYLRLRSDAQHWICLNTATGRQLEVKSPQRFRHLVTTDERMPMGHAATEACAASGL